MHSLASGKHFRYTASQMRTVDDHFDQHCSGAALCISHAMIDIGVVAGAVDRFERQRAAIEAAQSPIEVVALCNTATVSTVSLEPQWLGDKPCKSLGRQVKRVKIRWTGTWRVPARKRLNPTCNPKLRPGNLISSPAHLTNDLTARISTHFVICDQTARRRSLLVRDISCCFVISIFGVVLSLKNLDDNSGALRS